MDSDLVRIFWPSDVTKIAGQGILIGWRNSNHDTTVVGVLQGVTLRNAENSMQVGTIFQNPKHSLDHLLKDCGDSMNLQVLGTLNTQITKNDSDTYLHATNSQSGKPPSILYQNSPNMMLQIIIFDRPNPHQMQYMSLDPISISLDDAGHVDEYDPFFDEDRIEAKAKAERKKLLVKKLQSHTVIRHERTEKENALTQIVHQINSSYEVNELMQKNIGLIGPRSRRALSVQELVVESANSVFDYAIERAEYIFWQYKWPIVSHLFILMITILRLISEVMLVLLEWRFWSGRTTSLKDISATAQQIHIRLQQFCYWPAQYLTFRKRRNDWSSITSSHAEYIRLYNSLWLVANDIIIGVAFGSFILENADFVAEYVTYIVQDWFIVGLESVMQWLMESPAGLKLNNELAGFLGELFKWVILYWGTCIMSLQPFLPYIIRAVGLASFVGAGLAIAFLSDFISVLTAHIYAFYVASARIYNWQLTIIVSLFHLFRGKKRNILRNRIDSCDYDLDQLLLGTILFTLLTFLLPTVGVYYAYFASARIGLIFFKAMLDICLTCLNHFPLFPIVLLMKDPRRLPGKT